MLLALILLHQCHKDKEFSETEIFGKGAAQIAAQTCGVLPGLFHSESARCCWRGHKNLRVFLLPLFCACKRWAGLLPPPPLHLLSHHWDQVHDELLPDCRDKTKKNDLISSDITEKG